MKISTMWCVDDPGPLSELADICFETDAKKLVHVIAGTFASGSAENMKRMEALAIYTDDAEARADAERRIAARDAMAAAAPAAPVAACRVWGLFGGHVRLYESGDVRHWDAEEGRWCHGWGRWGSVDMSDDDLARDAEWEAAVEAYRTRAPTGATEPR